MGLVLLGLACDADPTEEAECTARTTAPCSCADNATGYQYCHPEMVWSMCICSGFDAALPDNPQADADVTPPQWMNDGGSNTGAGGQPMTTVDPCAPLRPAPIMGNSIYEIHIAEIHPGLGIELYNASDRVIQMREEEIRLHSDFYRKDAADFAETIYMDPKSYVLIRWPFFGDPNFPVYVPNAERGEVVLTQRGNILPSASNTIGYVCWGKYTGGHKNDSFVRDIYSGTCIEEPGLLSIHRKVGSSGASAASYNLAIESLRSCDPRP